MSDPFAMLDDAVVEHFGMAGTATDLEGNVTPIKVDVNDSFLDLMSGDVTINASEPKLGGKGIDWITQDHELEIKGARYRVNRDPETDIHGWSEIQVSRIYDQN
ncbi:hypothetical protein KDW99_08910 [Marinomonas rhizomae]|uniref:head-tail joining protein n=1 Tax=Marinomonas rhizomae TaxID=491948 RepID=UPI002104A74E|nr:hypothetical protein [Marinomonas rhizomae]UTW01227.1 hypothetical protein KDW99_08910 [Marinomonas rhizomae]